MRLLIAFCSLFSFVVLKAQDISSVKITILSTQMSDTKGVGEWGFSALVEADSKRILFDAGLKPTTVFDNANEMKISLANIPSLILSHNHLDHTGGVKKLTDAYSDSASFKTIYIGSGFFYRTANPAGLQKSSDSVSLANAGIKIEAVNKFREIVPGIYLTGPTPRIHDEKNYPPGRTINTPKGAVEDNVPEDMSMVIRTSEGLVLLSGCGHAGIINTLDHVRAQFPGKKIVAVIGGFHLLDTPEEKVRWTGERLKDAGIKYFIGAHCTGLNSVYQLRQVLGIKKEDCVVGTVGMTFTSGKGIAGGWMK